MRPDRLHVFVRRGVQLLQGALKPIVGPVELGHPFRTQEVGILADGWWRMAFQVSSNAHVTSLAEDTSASLRRARRVGTIISVTRRARR